MTSTSNSEDQYVQLSMDTLLSSVSPPTPVESDTDGSKQTSSTLPSPVSPLSSNPTASSCRTDLSQLKLPTIPHCLHVTLITPTGYAHLEGILRRRGSTATGTSSRANSSTNGTATSTFARPLDSRTIGPDGMPLTTASPTPPAHCGSPGCPTQAESMSTASATRQTARQTSKH